MGASNCEFGHPTWERIRRQRAELGELRRPTVEERLDALETLFAKQDERIDKILRELTV